MPRQAGAIVAGLERPAELRPAPLRGPAELRRQLLAWEPDPLDALLAPAGATAELVELDPEATIGDFDPRAFRRAWLTLTTADGRGLVPGTLGRVVVPPGTVAQVIFRPAGRVDGPAPQSGLERLFLQLLGPDVEQLHADLSRDIEASGNLGRRADEPAALDPLLRPAFWRFYSFRRRARDLDAQLAQLVGLDDAERAELMRLVAMVRDQTFRDGAAIGVALQASGLQHHLGPEIAEGRALKRRQRKSADLTNADARRVALKAEQDLFRAWRTHGRAIKRDFETAGDQAAELLRRAPQRADGEELLSPHTVVKMVRAWERGHDPTQPGAGTWRQFSAGRKGGSGSGDR